MDMVKSSLQKSVEQFSSVLNQCDENIRASQLTPGDGLCAIVHVDRAMLHSMFPYDFESCNVISVEASLNFIAFSSSDYAVSGPAALRCLQVEHINVSLLLYAVITWFAFPALLLIQNAANLLQVRFNLRCCSG